MEQAIDTGDHVHHAPTGEDWVVAFVRDGRLAWCGWPEGVASLSDCTLKEKATPEAREKLLREMASMSGSDMRKSYALHRLEQTHNEK